MKIRGSETAVLLKAPALDDSVAIATKLPSDHIKNTCSNSEPTKNRDTEKNKHQFSHTKPT